LAERDIRSWPWEHGDRPEQSITSALRDLLDPGIDLALALIVRDAILAGASERIVVDVVGDAPLWGYESRTRAGPDLCVIDADNRIRVVVEHKCGAKANCEPYPLFNTLTRFNDPLALSLPARPAETDDIPDTGPWGQGLLWQTDYYRCTRDWIRPLETGEPVTLPDATAVLWILLDIDGRDARELFWDGHTSGDWITTSYQQFLPPLISAYDDPLSHGRKAMAERVEPLLRMIGS
jgi:hypothetical protein